MKENEKLLEAKLKLATDILRNQNRLLYDLRTIATSCRDILISAKDGKSTDNDPIFKFTKEQIQTLEDLIYTAKSEKLTSQNTASYLKDFAREIEIKQEILDSL